jgi:large subunit GTPase 1
MPSSQGTSRKGKPKALDRAAGMGRALQKAQGVRYKPRSNGKSRTGDGGMQMQHGVTSIGIQADMEKKEILKTKSVLEVHNVDDFLQQASAANREFVSEREGLVVLDATGQVYRGPSSVKWQDDEYQQQGSSSSSGKRDSFVFTELSVPRRPAWDESTTVQQLERNEQVSFLEWRRGIAHQEEELMKQQQQQLQQSNTSGSNNIKTQHISVTPFEKNLEVWRQLWRVLERSSCLLQLVDARNPLFYLSHDLRNYAASLNKPMMVLVNKSDYLSRAQRAQWRDYLQQTQQNEQNNHWTVVFFSAAVEQQKLDQAAQRARRELDRKVDPRLDNDNDSDDDNAPHDVVEGRHGEDDDDEIDDSDSDDSNSSSSHAEEKEDLQEQEEEQHEESKDGVGVDVPLSREQLLETMLRFAHEHNCQPDARYDNRIQFGMVGFPNVGKSSVINVLMGSSKHTHGMARVAVASQPGKTKHFQTLLLPDVPEMMLCDCPGLVFPSFVSNTADLIAAGVYPIAQMRDHWPVTNLIAQRIPRQVLNAHYGIQLPVPSPCELRERGWSTSATMLPPPTGEELLTTYCIARSMLTASSGLPDHARAARYIIKDYADGKLLYCHAPPIPNLDVVAFNRETVETTLHNTKKIRDALQRQQEKLLKKKNKQSKQLQEAATIKSLSEAEKDGNVDNDDILLEFLDVTSAINANTSASSPLLKTSTKKKKHGKKNRKNRNSDPYGCHSTPDEELLEQVAGDSSSGMGVTVNAGRRGKKQGYTRPTGYGASRGGAVVALGK